MAGDGVRDAERREAKLRDAKKRARWTMPLEHYYPTDWLSGSAKPVNEPVIPASSTRQRRYIVKPAGCGCHVIYPQFGGVGIRFRNRADGTRGEH